MILQALEPHHAEQIADLAADYYPQELLVEAEEIAHALTCAVREGSNYSVGLLEKGKLLAYMLAWQEESRIEGRRESVVLIDDLALATGEIEDLRLLFAHLVKQLQSSGLTHLAIEGSLLAETRELFLKQGRFFASLGYEMVASQDYWEEDLGAELTWVRYERPLEAEAQAASEAWDGSEFPSMDEEFEVFPE